MMRVIDPPSPFSPAEEWQGHLADLQQIEPRDAQVEGAIRMAQAMVDAWRRGGIDAATEVFQALEAA